MKLKLFFFLICNFVITNLLTAQETYIIKYTTEIDYDGNRKFQDVALMDNFNYIYDNKNWKGDVFKVLSNSEGIQTSYYTIDEGSYIGLRFDYRDFQALSSIDQWLFYYYINSPKSYSEQSYFDKIWACDGGCKTHKGTITFSVDAYDAPSITNISIAGCEDCSDGTICISDIYGNITFTLNAKYPGNCYLGIYAYDKNDNLIGSTGIGYAPTNVISDGGFFTKDVKFSSLNLQKYFGEPIYFKVSSYLNGASIFGAETKDYYFFKQMPTPLSYQIIRKACYPSTTIYLTLQNGMAASAGDYNYVAVNGDCEEGNCNTDASGMIQLKQTGYVSGNTISLIPLNEDSDNMFDASGDYTIQISQKLSSLEGEDFNKISCATKKAVEVGAKPSTLHLTGNPVEYTFQEDTFHISRPGANNGKIAMSVPSGQQDRIRRFEYYDKNGQFYEIYPGNLDYSDPDTTYYINLQSNTVHSVRILDTDLCYSNTVTTPVLREPSPVALDSFFTTKATCSSYNTADDPNKLKDGMMRLYFSGGIGPYYVKVLDNNGNWLRCSVSGINSYSYQTLPQLPASSYTVTITDRFGTKTSRLVNLLSNPEFLINYTATDIKCSGEETGTLSVSSNYTDSALTSFTVSSIDYVKTINTTRNDTVFKNLYADYYTISAMNSLGCIDEINDIHLSEPLPLIINASGSKIARYGDSTGTININMSGATPSYNYTIFNGTELKGQGNTNNTIFLSDLKDGIYNLEITDYNGCEYSKEGIRVRQPDAPLTLTYTQKNVDCFGNSTGGIYPVASGGWGHYSYGFNNVNSGEVSSITGLSATQTDADTVFVVDSALVVEKQPVILTEPEKLLSTLEKATKLNCFNDGSGSASFTISGGTPDYRISADNLIWQTSNEITGLQAGNQTIYISDANDCINEEEITLAQPEKLEITADTIVDAYCKMNSGAIYHSSNGGNGANKYCLYYTDSLQTFNSTEEFFSNIYSGVYKLYVNDQNNCSDSLELVVKDFDGPEVTGFLIDSVSCFNGSDGKITITEITGGLPDFQYFLNNNKSDSVIQGLEKDTYHFRVVDKNSCKADCFFDVSEPNPMEIYSTRQAPVCHNTSDGFIIADATGGNGGYSYLWDNNSTEKSIDKLSKGTYVLTVLDKKGCQINENYVLLAPLAPTVHLEKNANILCTGNSLNLDGGNFESQRWYKDGLLISSDPVITVGESGLYVLEITNEYGCLGKDTLKLEVSDTPLDAKLLVQDSALVDEIVTAIDVTWPVPDSIQWMFNNEVSRYDYNNWSQEFATSSEGILNVTLRAWYGGCFSDSSKTVYVFYEEDSIPVKSTLNEPLILGLTVYPNPNDGNFALKVKLSRKADITIRLYDMHTGKLLNTKEDYALDRYELPFNLSRYPAGVYAIVLIAENEQQRIKVVVE